MKTERLFDRLYPALIQLMNTSICLIIVSGSTLSCQESSVSCLSDRQCDEESTCVAGQCLGSELKDREAFVYYKEEMHFRLVAECGICHAAAEESQPPPPVSMDIEDQNSDPYKLPVYTSALGDSGWRIFTEALTEEKLWASYLDTMQYINLSAPAESLLFAFGRGDVGISAFARHPKLYTTRAEREIIADQSGADSQSLSTNNALFVTAPIGYERLVNWARLPHISPEVITYNLENYQNGAQAALSGSCAGCHNGDPLLPKTAEEGERIPRGGFAFNTIASELADLAPLTALINLDDPPNSALIRLIIGEYDHPNYTVNGEADVEALSEALIPWIESLRR